MVTSIERSLPLYRELLEPLGYDDVHEVVGERGEPVFYLDGRGVGASVSLREAQSPAGVYDRYSVGLHHLAFEASSREQVDERLAWAKAKGLHIEDEPKEWGHAPGYYAGFFHDPDGIKLEIVHIPESERSKMTTTPPEERPGATGGMGTSPTAGTTGTTGMPWMANIPSGARLPLPGNAEFAVYAIAQIVAFIVAWLADSLTANDWFSFFLWTTAAYLLSRGIAKATRVLEQ